MKGFSSDKASVMVGCNNSVLSRIRKATDNKVFDLGCVSHIASLAASQMVKALHLPIEDLLIDTYYFFHRRYISLHKYNGKAWGLNLMLYI